VLVEQVISLRNALPVPALPGTGLVAGDQDDRAALRIEREEQTKLGSPRGSWTKLFQVLVSGTHDAVHQRSTEVWTMLLQQLDGSDDLLARPAVQGGEPFRDQLDVHDPCHHSLEPPGSAHNA